MNITGKKVLVTGADGFIGSHLVEALVAAGATVRAFVFYNSFNSWGWLDTIPKNTLDQIEVVAGDIRDVDRVVSASNGCDMIFHLAALIAIPFSYESPRSYVETNITGTLNVLHAARENSVSRVLITSTSEVYGTAKYVPIDELHPLQGQSPYSATKIGADRIAESFFRSFQTPVVIVRPFNTYGPRQSARAVIPTIITQLLSGVSELKLGRLDTVRDFTFVEDTARGFIELAQAESAVGEEVNIATGVGVTIGETAQALMEVLEREVPVVGDDVRMRPENSEVERLIGANDKMKRLTGWKPQTALREGLQKTVEWFKAPENLARYKSHLYNL